MPANDHGHSATVLIVEPDDGLARQFSQILLSARIRSLTASTGHEAIGLVTRSNPNLVLMEWTLPDMSGLGLCRSIRAQGTVPVIVISATDSIADTVASFEAGADGFLTKPVRTHELVARIGAALRRSPHPRNRRRGEVFVVGEVTLDVEGHEVWVGAKALNLPLREFRLLEALVANAGKVWTKDALRQRIWGGALDSGSKSLGVHISRLRSRIEEDPTAPTRILTVRGIGYTYALGQSAQKVDHDLT